MILIILASSPFKALALKQAIFPDEKSLQPIPTTTVRPNISGNVNSTVNPSPISEPEFQPNQTNDSDSPFSNGATNEKSLFFYLIRVLAVFLVIVILFLIYKKIRERKDLTDQT